MHSSIRETNSCDQNGKKQKNCQKSLQYNANAFFHLTALMVEGEIRDKSSLQLEIGLKAFYQKTTCQNYVEHIQYCEKYQGRMKHAPILKLLFFFFFTFEIDPVGVELPPLLWYFLYISCSDIVSMHPVYIYLKRFDLTFLGEKYSIKTNLLGFEVANHSL